MLSENQIEQLCERLVNRIELANTYFLQKIGESVKQLRSLTPTQAHQLVNILKYGSNYQEIVNEISRLTNLNIKEIDEIFYQFAKKDQTFYRKFYEYRNKPFIPINENIALKNQVLSLANITKREMYNYMQTRALGYSIKDLDGKTVFLGLQETYNRVLDEAVLNVGQGVDTFDSAMARIMKEIGGSGLKTLDFENGRSYRLDSMVRQHLQGALRDLHNNMQEQYGKEFDSDGVEISVHLNPAPDHAEVQGRQFSNEEFENFQNDIDAKDYTGKLFSAGFEGHDRRSISEYNCYHYIFAIILGVSKSNYNEKELQDIINHSNEKVAIDGKEYTKYECTQLQRNLERRIREQKDIQILGRASDNKELIAESQSKITQLTKKYKELSEISGLPTKMDRLRVSGYKRVAIKK